MKRNNEFVFPCRTSEMLQEAQLSSIAVYRAEGGLKRQTSSEEKEEARDPDPSVEVRQDF